MRRRTDVVEGWRGAGTRRRRVRAYYTYVRILYTYRERIITSVYLLLESAIIQVHPRFGITEVCIVIIRAFFSAIPSHQIPRGSRFIITIFFFCYFTTPRAPRMHCFPFPHLRALVYCFF